MVLLLFSLFIIPGGFMDDIDNSFGELAAKPAFFGVVKCLR